MTAVENFSNIRLRAEIIRGGDTSDKDFQRLEITDPDDGQWLGSVEVAQKEEFYNLRGNTIQYFVGMLRYLLHRYLDEAELRGTMKVEITLVIPLQVFAVILDIFENYPDIMEKRENR